jgi:YidC/Oxa1 family membrane protein insertase
MTLLTIVIVLVYAFSGGPKTPIPAESEQAAPADAVQQSDDAPDDQPDSPSDPEDADEQPPADQPAPVETTPPAADAIEAAPALDLTNLRAVAPAGFPTSAAGPAQPLGSFDPAVAAMRLDLTGNGAGVATLAFSDIWDTAEAKRQAAAHSADNGATPLPDDEHRYVLAEQLVNNARGFPVSVLSAHQVTINDTVVPLIEYSIDDLGQRVYVWAETAPGTFETTILNPAGVEILHITRRYILGDDYDLTLQQHLENRTGQPLSIQWSQFGPGDLSKDSAAYMDRRRYRFGFTIPEMGDKVLSSDDDLLYERTDIHKMESPTVWPNEYSQENNLDLVWFASTSRYFGLAVHPVLDDDGAGPRTLSPVVSTIMHEEVQADRDSPVFTYLVSPVTTIEPGASINLDLGVFAGPLDRHILENEQPYIALSMDKLVLFQMSSMCAFCTFQWLAHGLLAFLTFLDTAIVFDWAIAIIILVLCVRAILHPLTKKSQISMQRFGKIMQEIKPETEKLQKKYADDPKRLQAEQMKLMRERGANPLQMLGCLPMFLQMPIWVALYAMLYFVFDLRHEAAFYGVFQLFGDWSFLGDLSAPDHFISLPFTGKFWMIDYSHLNILPLLMGAVFFFQQKYMTPPSTGMSKEQQSQQKMMRVMMVVMFPIMLYSAPSGLTLYILTSSCIGILESKYVRAHIKEMDLKPKEPKKTGKTPRDAKGRAYAAAVKRMEEKRRQKKQGPEKHYKKRK